MRAFHQYPDCMSPGCTEPALVPGTCYDHAVPCPNCKDPSFGEMDHYNGAEWDCDYRSLDDAN